jgi:hypothetical protein
MGSAGGLLPDQNSAQFFVLNNSVLTKMPRDCTAPLTSRCTVPAGFGYPILIAWNMLTLQTMQQNRPKYLESLVANHRLTPDGKEWLTLALDPFHDFQHQAAGYPDADGSQTLVSCYQYQADISVPPGVVGNWDCHIYNNPLLTTNNCQIVNQQADLSYCVEVAPAVPFNTGILSMIAVPTGSAMVPVAPAPAIYSYSALPAPGNSDLSAGVTRVIGLGFEIVNTTAEINKQGAVTCYRMPQYIADTGSMIQRNAASSVLYNMPQRRVRMPPSTIAQANLLKGTRTWDASSGVYATAAQNSVSNPLCTWSNAQMVVDPVANLGAASQAHVTGWNIIAVNASPLVSGATPNCTKFGPFDTTGAMFTGLSNETTLTVKLRVYVERAPTWAEPGLAVLATPSAGYDPLALELYSHAISHLPVAVTVGENSAGDWFRAVVRTLKDVAGPLTNLLGPVVPGASQMGTAVQSVLGKMDAWMSNNQSHPSISNSVGQAKGRSDPSNSQSRNRVNRTPTSQQKKKKRQVRAGALIRVGAN